MNSLFIGLGGAGTNALGELQKKFEDYDLVSGTHSLNNYLYVDTDLAIRDKYPFIDAKGDFLPIGAGEVPSTIMDLAFNPNNASRPENIRFAEWIDKFNPSLRACHDFTSGASGERMLTRMITWKQYSTITGRLTGKLRLSNGNPVERIYVVSGTAGGTGCGSLMDILYMLREIQQNGNMVNNFPKVNLMLVMPHGYIEVYDKYPDDPRLRNYKLNAYGLLSEINAVLKDRWANVKYKKNANGEFLNKDNQVTTNPDEYVEEPNPVIGKQWTKHSVKPSSPSVVNNMYFEPFDKAYFFDSHDFDTSSPYDYDTVSERVAEFVFNLEVGNTVRRGLDSVFSNVLIANRIDSAKKPYIKAFCSTGTYTIQTHEELRKRYVQERFVYQMMAHGFMGKESDYAAPQTPDAKMWEELNDKIIDFFDSSWNIVEELYKDVDRSELIEVLQNLEKAAKERTKTPSFKKVFNRFDNKSLQREYTKLCNSLKEIVYNNCGEWIATYNLVYAKAQIEKEDLNATGTFNNDILEIKKLVPNFLEKKTKLKKTLLRDLKTAFEKYIHVLANRFLSDDGIFDDCKTILANVTTTLNFEEFEIRPKRQLVKWESHFIKDVMNLQNDPTRKFIPDVSTLIAGSGLSGKCDFAEKYAGIVSQVEGTNLPDMELSLGASGLKTTVENTLPWYKEKILNEINEYNPEFSKQFRPDNLKVESTLKFVFNQFLIYTQKEARSITHDKDIDERIGLSEPIDNKLTTATEISNVAQELYNAKGTFLSTSEHGASHPLRAIYLGQYGGINGGNLQKTIQSQSGFNPAENTIQPDNSAYWGDRYVKVLAKMNYGIDDYAFFEQYKSFFTDYHDEHKDDWARHMPFSSLKFWNCENADIVALFNKGAEETAIAQLKGSLEWDNEKQVYAFGFMAVLLCEYYERLSTLAGSKKFIKKFQSLTKGKTTIKPISREKNNVTLTYSSDFLNNPTQEKYYVDREEGTKKVNIASKISAAFVGEVKDVCNRYIRYWITVVNEALKYQTVSDEDTLYKNAYDVVYAIANKVGKSTLVRNLFEPYYDAKKGTKKGERDFFEEYLMWFSK